MHFRSDEKLRNVKKWDRTESWTPTRFPCRCQLYCCSCCNLHGLSSSPCLFSTCTSFHFKWFPFILKVCVGLWSLASESFLLPLVPDTLLTSSAYIQVIMRKTFAKRFLGNENLPLESYLAKEFWINEGGGHLQGRPVRIAELPRSKFDPELFPHSAYVEIFVTFATKVPYLTFCNKMWCILM